MKKYPGFLPIHTVKIADADSGFFLASTAPAGTTINDISQEVLISKQNKDGRQVWMQTYEAVGHTLLLTDFIKTFDGAYVSVGKIIDTEAFFLIKTDSSGSVLWSRAIAMKGAKNAYSLISSADGAIYLITGLATANGSIETAVVKTDADGNLKWTQSYFSTYSDAGSAVLCANGDIFIRSGNFIFRIDKEGRLIHARSYSGLEKYKCEKPVEVSDGGFLFGLYSHEADRFFFLKTNAKGKMVYVSRLFAKGALQDGLAMPDNSVLFAGRYNSGRKSVHQAPSVFRVSPDGKGLKIYAMLDTADKSQGYLHQVFPGKDGGLYFSGHHLEPGESRSSGMSAKLDTLLDIPCGYSFETESEASLNFDVKEVTCPENKNHLVESVNLRINVNVLKPEDTTICHACILPRLDLQDTIICGPKDLILDAGVGGNSYLWNNGVKGRTTKIFNSGLYSVDKTNECGTRQDSMKISFFPALLPKVELSFTTGRPEDLLIGEEKSTNLVSRIWDFGDGNSSPNSYFNHVYHENGDYPLTVDMLDSNGCRAKFKQTIHIVQCNYEIPDAFSPDGNQLNEVFQPIGMGFSYKMEIYNRWGERIYSGSDKGWDGTYKAETAPQGVYLYQINFTLLNGKTEFRKGNVTLLR